MDGSHYKTANTFTRLKTRIPIQRCLSASQQPLESSANFPIGLACVNVDSL